MSTLPQTLLIVLLLLVMGSAIQAVVARHQTRELFIELQTLSRARDGLDVEWGRLQLELGAWSRHSRIEQIARQKLGMVPVDAELTRLVVQ